MEFTGEAVNVTEAKEQEGGGHAAEEKVFQGRFRGANALLVERRHGVKAKAEELQGDKDHQQILRADEEHHRDGGEEKQREIFADVVCEIGIDGQPSDEDRK